MKQESEYISEKDLTGEVEFKIDKEAFNGPFRCCGLKTKKTTKRMSIKGTEFSYEVWRCSKCKKEFLDTEQAQRLEKIWMIEKILDEKLISIERKVNFDGKTFFVRFPMEITKRWHKGAKANIRLLSPDEFFIKVEG